MPDLNFVEDPNHNLYQASFGSIFWRNFVAGFSRALGGLVVTVVIVGIVTYFTFKALWPQLQPLINTFTQATENLQETNRTLQETQSSLNGLNGSFGSFGTQPGTGSSSVGTATQIESPSALSPAAINQLYQELQGKNGSQ